MRSLSHTLMTWVTIQLEKQDQSTPNIEGQSERLKQSKRFDILTCLMLFRTSYEFSLQFLTEIISSIHQVIGMLYNPTSLAKLNIAKTLPKMDQNFKRARHDDTCL